MQILIIILLVLEFIFIPYIIGRILLGENKSYDENYNMLCYAIGIITIVALLLLFGLLILFYKIAGLM